MKALTIWQPWSYLIASGTKPVENRVWATSYRGPLAIHAGRRWDKGGGADYRVMRAMHPFLNPRQYPEPIDPAEHPDRFVFGAVIAVAQLSDCHRAAGCCEPWGDPDVGDRPTWHWVLTDVRPLADFPSVAGRQGLWNWVPDSAQLSGLAHQQGHFDGTLERLAQPAQVDDPAEIRARLTELTELHDRCSHEQ